MSEINKFYVEKGTQDLSAGSLTLEFEAPFDCYFLAAMLHASIAISQAVVVTHVDDSNSAYDTVLNSTTLSSETDYVHRPSERHPIKKGEKIKITCANSGTPAATAAAKIYLGQNP